MTHPTSQEIRASMVAQVASPSQCDRILGPVRPKTTRRNAKPESALLHECLLYLKPRCRWVHRQNSGAYKDGDRYIVYGFPGQPDIIGQLHDGRIIFVECKSPKGVMSPQQTLFFSMVPSPFVVAIVARSIDDLACLV